VAKLILSLKTKTLYMFPQVHMLLRKQFRQEYIIFIIYGFK